MMLQRRALFAGGGDDWDDPDVFTDTTLWLDMRPELRTFPFTLPFYLYVNVSNEVWVDWGDGTNTDILGKGNHTLSHTYQNLPNWYVKLVIHGKTTDAFSSSIGNNWDCSYFHNGSTERTNLGITNNLVIRARIGSANGRNAKSLSMISFVSNCDTWKDTSFVANADITRDVKVRKWLIANSTNVCNLYNMKSDSTVEKIDVANIQSGSYLHVGNRGNHLLYFKINSNYAFQCGNLQSVKCIVLGPNCSSISDYYGFQTNSGLEHLLIQKQEAVVTYTNGQIYTAGNLQIHVPNALVAAYKSTDPWSSWSDRIVGYDDPDEEEVRLATLYGCQKPWTIPRDPVLT